MDEQHACEVHKGMGEVSIRCTEDVVPVNIGYMKRRKYTLKVVITWGEGGTLNPSPSTKSRSCHLFC